MATFMQWRRRRPAESDIKAMEALLSKTRLVWITGSKLDYLLYVDDWWRKNYKGMAGVSEFIVISAEDEYFWEALHN